MCKHGSDMSLRGSHAQVGGRWAELSRRTIRGIGRIEPKAVVVHCLYYWQVAPVTVAVITGPIITTAYRLTRSSEAAVSSFSLAQALRGALCFAMIVALVVARRLRVFEHRLIRPLLFLGAYALLTAWITPHPYENLVFAIRLGFVCTVFVSAFNLASHGLCGDRWLSASAWMVLLLMGASEGLGLLTGNTVAIYGSAYATAGLADQPAITAALILSVLPIFVAQVPDNRSASVATGITLVALFLTMRRTELIAAVGALVVVLLGSLNASWYRPTWTRLLPVVVCLAALIAVGSQTPAAADFWTRVTELDPRAGSGSGRYAFWTISLKHLCTRDFTALVFGEGMGSIRDLLYRYYGNSIPAHNAWLDLTHAHGLFGLVAVTWWYGGLIAFMGRLRRSRQSTSLKGVVSVGVVLLLVSAGQGEFYDPSYALTYAALGFWAGSKVGVRYAS